MQTFTPYFGLWRWNCVKRSRPIE